MHPALRTVLGGLLLLAAVFAVAADTTAADPGNGCLHGTVTTTDGRVLTGFLRTENDDAFWDDILRATLTASPWADVIDTEALARQRRAAYFQDHGLIDRIAFVLSGSDRHGVGGREFLCRYGQVARITLDKDAATVETIDGGRHVCRRRVPDLRGDLTVAGSDSAVVAWDDVRDVVFTQAVPGAAPPWRRLAGTVTTSDGVLEGFIQWDLSECTTDGILDGEQDGEDHDVPMGDIAAIAKERDGSRVILRDGRSLLLTGTNDVNADNRGIAVEVAGLGRVIVAWTRFERVDFAAPGESGSGRGSYAPGGELTGEVTDTEGAVRRGRLVWDLDEGWTWDIFNGGRRGFEYEIPFARIAAVERVNDGCRVLLRSGDVLDLDAGQDASAANRGLLVLGGDAPQQIPWDAVRRVDFAP